ncbi:uncharacterized protein LOC114316773 isoform X8 [Camellia sinensis]|uniref:uncharacterized protein LOC114316773 isoform X8 n=1 Tax=Camellia sinensis TaxID=4442 RepID=UPI001035F71F|nr:uncharacterized protein LOC114316773 isoform X8 [Camellia sinensis]
MVSIIVPFQKCFSVYSKDESCYILFVSTRCSTKCHNGIAKMRFVISVLLFLVFILFGVPFVLYSTRQVLLIALAQIKRFIMI